jgi:hypothetical protein
MKTSIAFGKSLSTRIPSCTLGLLLFALVSCLPFNALKSQNCNLCAIPSFPSFTVYQAFQTGHGMGFGFEAGNWKKDAGKFSYFLGTSMVWANTNNAEVKSSSGPTQLLLGFYVKGQYKLTSHLYVVAAPGIVNLTYFEFQTGLRYVVPLTSKIGFGIEPAYAFNQKEAVVNVNVHFALR